jgi:hypothetical protein
MPGHEGLRQADLGDEIGNRGVGLGQATDDPKPVDIGEGLVDKAQLAKVGGLVDDRRDRGPDTGG